MDVGFDPGPWAGNWVAVERDGVKAVFDERGPRQDVPAGGRSRGEQPPAAGRGRAARAGVRGVASTGVGHRPRPFGGRAPRPREPGLRTLRGTRASKAGSPRRRRSAERNEGRPLAGPPLVVRLRCATAYGPTVTAVARDGLPICTTRRSSAPRVTEGYGTLPTPTTPLMFAELTPTVSQFWSGVVGLNVSRASGCSPTGNADSSVLMM